MDMTHIDILSSFYGQKYCDMLMDTCMPSLYKYDIKDNDFFKDKILTHNIYCPVSEAKQIQDKYVPWAKERGISVVVNSALLPGPWRNLVYNTFIDQANKAEINKAVVIVAQPDHLFCNGMSNVIKRMEYGDYMVCGHPRISYEDGYSKIIEVISSPAKQTNKDLAKIFIEDIPHSLVKQAKEAKHDYIHIEPRDYGYAGFFKEPPPIAWWGGVTDIMKGFGKPRWGYLECVDHEIPDVMYKKGKLKWVDDNDEFMWAEFTSNDTYPKMITNNWWSEAAKKLHTVELKWRTR